MSTTMEKVTVLLDDPKQRTGSFLLQSKINQLHSKQFNLTETLRSLYDETNPYFITLWKLDAIREKSFILHHLQESFNIVKTSKFFLFKRKGHLLNLVENGDGLMDESLERSLFIFNRLFANSALELEPKFRKIDFKLFESQVLNQNRNILNEIYAFLLNDRECAMRLLGYLPTEFEFFGENLRFDRNFLLETIPKYPNAIKHTSKELQNDREVILKAVTKNGLTLEYASENLRNDREIVYKAILRENISNQMPRIPLCIDVQFNPHALALKFASSQFQNDRELVMKTIYQNPLALEFASEKLQNCKKIVKIAVEEFGDTLKFASEELRKDEELIELASSERNIYKYIDMD